MLLTILISSCLFYVDYLKTSRDKALIDNKKLQSQILTLGGVIDHQRVVINQVSALRKIDADIITRMYQNSQALTRQMNLRSETRRELEKTNVAIKNYLDQPVPDDLRVMFNNQFTRNGDKD